MTLCRISANIAVCNALGTRLLTLMYLVQTTRLLTLVYLVQKTRLLTLMYLVQKKRGCDCAEVWNRFIDNRKEGVTY